MTQPPFQSRQVPPGPPGPPMPPGPPPTTGPYQPAVGPQPPYPGQGGGPAQPPWTAGPSAASGQPLPPGPAPSRARADHGARDGAITAGVWLISIGLVFLVRDWAGWSWGQAWPLFVIAASAAAFVTSLLRRDKLDAGSWSLLWPIAWLVIGIVLLAGTTGQLGMGLGELFSRWWPVALILVGLWFLVAAVWPGRRRPVESLTLPLGPSLGADVKLTFGGGVLDIGRATRGSLVSGTFQGGVRYRTNGPDSVELQPDTGRGWPMGGATFRWTVGLTGEKPLDLRLDTGASRATIDLLDLLVHRLEVHSGAADTRIRLPRAAGQTFVRADTGVASLLIEVPPGVAARIRSDMALGRLDIDERRFPRVADGWASPDYATAPNRADMEIKGGVGSVTVR